MRLDAAFGIDLEEQFGRTRQHDRIAERHQRTVFHRLARGQRIEGGQRIAGPLRTDREGEVGLVAVAGAQVIMEALEALFIVLERPGGASIEDRPVRRGRVGMDIFFGRRFVEDAQAEQRRAAALRQQGNELGLKQVARFVGKIAGEPFAGVMRRLRGLQRRQEILRGPGRDDFGRAVKDELARALVVAKDCGGQ